VALRTVERVFFGPFLPPHTGQILLFKPACIEKIRARYHRGLWAPLGGASPVPSPRTAIVVVVLLLAPEPGWPYSDEFAMTIGLTLAGSFLLACSASSVSSRL
jgi:hypothetical protein